LVRFGLLDMLLEVVVQVFDQLLVDVFAEQVGYRELAIWLESSDYERMTNHLCVLPC
jgi:hypothetical protein